MLSGRRLAALVLLAALGWFSAHPLSARAEVRIVNGTVSASGAWPAMAALVESDKTPSEGHFCGGTLVAPRWVLTAAHCTSDMDASSLYVVLGETDLDAGGGERVQVESILTHPDYNELTLDSDLALLLLASASSRATARVIGQDDPLGLAAAGRTGTVVGWGRIGLWEQQSSRLLQADLRILSAVEAAQDYAFLYVAVTDNMIAAGVRGGGTASCKGDSGGPLYVADASGTGHEVAGVVSWSNGCAAPEQPSVFTRLSRFSDWIATATNSSLRPSLTVTHPVDGATEVPVNTALFAQFSTDMDNSTINASTVTLADDLGNPVAGSVQYDTYNRMALFRPSSPLAASSPYTATVSTGAANLNGVSPASPATFSFTTAVGPDQTRPRVVGFNPPSGSTGVSLTPSISVVFDEYMDPASINASTLGIDDGIYPDVVYEALSKTAVIRASDGVMERLKDYTAHVSAEASDLCGNALGSAASATFTTGNSPAELPFAMSYMVPANGTTNRTIATVVSVGILQPMDPSSITQDSIILENAGGRVAGTVQFDALQMDLTFTPTNYLEYATIYTATLDKGVKNQMGEPLGYPLVWTFATANANGTDANSTTSTRVPSAKGSGDIQVSLSTANARLYGVSAMSDTDTGINTTGKPSDYAFPDGLLAYQISVPVTSPGSSATVSLTFPNVTNGTRVYKVDSSGFSLFAGVTVSSGNTVTMTVTDGGAGDTDGIINGVINDPVGLAAVPTPGGSGGGGGGGCSLAPDAQFGLEALLAALTPLLARRKRPKPAQRATP